jgi:predicted Zn finger-like uncharacterized protein
MALATKCPHCHTVFRVALDQLKLRGGIVRCGACNEIFDGNAALVEPSASLPGAAIPVLMPSPAMPAGLDLELDLDEVLVKREPVTANEADDDESRMRSGETERSAPLQASTATPARSDAPGHPGDAPAGPAPTSAFGLNATADVLAEPEPEPEPEPPASISDRREPAFDMPSEHIVAMALDDLHHFDDEPEPVIPSPVLLDAADHEVDDTADHAAGRAADDTAAADLLTAAPESALLAAGAGAVSALIAEPAPATPAMPDEPDVPDAQGDEPEFVRQADRRERTQGITRLAMIAGIPLLAFVLLAQGVHSLRNGLAASYPAMKPALQALCAPLGCTVGLPRQIDALAIEQGELQTLAPNTYSFVTVLRNQSRSVQAWPHIELVLNDTADKPVLRRVFAPRDYLARPADVAQGFGPRSEQPVKLYFQLDRLRASGYHIAIFHP